MDARSDTSSVPHGLSSSLPPQHWSNHSSATTRTHVDLFDIAPVDQSTLAQRTTALRQLNGLPRRLQRRHRQTTSAGSRSSLASQPVTVRTYSAENNSPKRSSTMPQTSGGLLNGSANDGIPRPLPPVEEFSIDGILRAIEPDIRSTLDAIAEICGRSKLSLANEYGSHRPPLGEIRASGRTVEHGLHPVEEASSSNERLVDQNVVIVGEDTSTVDGRDPYSSNQGLFGNLPQPTSVLGYRSSMPPSWERGSSSQHQANQQRATASPSHREGKSEAKKEAPGTKASLNAFDWGLLGSRTDQDKKGHRRTMSTEPVISEVHLDAQAEGTSQQPTADDSQELSECQPRNDVADESVSRVKRERLSFLADLQEWLSWFRTVGNKDNRGHNSSVSLSAETRLRTVLERQNPELSHANETGVAVPAGAS